MRLAAMAGLLFLSSCALKSLSKDPGDPAWGVEVTWHGHSCFTLRDSVGRTLVIDPFDQTVGYGRLSLRADSLLITHNHFDHNFRKGVKARYKEIELIETTGTIKVANGVEVTGIPAFHDDEKGEVDGPDIIYTIAFGGMRVVHLGDLGQSALTPEQKKQIGPVDLLFIPVGGVRTLDSVQAKKIVDELRPKFVFPMHYGNIRFYPLQPVTLFTKLFSKEQERSLKDSTVRVKPGDFAGKPLIYLLNPSQGITNRPAADHN